MVIYPIRPASGVTVAAHQLGLPKSRPRSIASATESGPFIDDFIGAFARLAFRLARRPCIPSAPPTSVLDFRDGRSGPLHSGVSPGDIIGRCRPPLFRAAPRRRQRFWMRGRLPRACLKPATRVPPLAAYAKQRLRTTRIVSDNRTNPPDAILREVFPRPTIGLSTRFDHSSPRTTGRIVRATADRRLFEDHLLG